MTEKHPLEIPLWEERLTLQAMVDDTSRRRLLRRVTVLGEAPNGAEAWPAREGEFTASSRVYGIGRHEF